MPIKRPPAENSASLPSEQAGDQSPGRRTNPAINARLDDYITRSPADFDRYTTLVKEDPAYAVRSLMLKDMMKFEDEMRLVTTQLPQAKKFLESLSKEEQAKIQAKVDSVDPMFRDHRLVKEIRAHMGRESFKENARKLMPKPGARVAA
jgi:hypothetical protein